LKVAGAVFAKLFVGGLADMLQVVILHRTFRSLRAKINSKIPPPAEVEGFKKGAEAKAEPKTDSKPATEEAKAEKSKAESAKDKAALTERAKEASDAAKERLKEATVDTAASSLLCDLAARRFCPPWRLSEGSLWSGRPSLWWHQGEANDVADSVILDH
jgi:hypothetical protein